MSKPFKGKLCYNHLPRPGFRYGSRDCACLRHVGHEPPCRAAGRWEWTGWNPKTCFDRKTGRTVEL